MATNATWTVIFDDKKILNQSVTDEGQPIGYVINDDAFWNQSKFSNIWAIQYGTSVASDAVEYRDDTSHSEYDSAVLGDFQEFIDRWNTAHAAAQASEE
tara:strand:+ start:247 stop:543 length:297 start_codon:yes stop_codon:yes gene_type:complete